MAAILGFGGYVPERVMTNDDWAVLLDTSDEWITSRTGIKRRHFAAEDEATVDLAAAAAELAIADAGLTADDIDEIIVATDTPEAYTPDTASFLQHRLGCREVPAYDLGGSGCAGFVLALDVARARMLLAPKRILVVGVELISRLMSWEDRSFCVLFGDAAGSVVLGPGSGRAEMLNVVAGTDGSQTDILTLKTGGTRHPFNAESLASGAYHHLDMDGRRVFREAVHRMTDAVADVLEPLGKTVSDVDLVIPHQANKRIIDAVGQRLQVAEDAVYVNVQDYGNTGSATVPFALWEAVGKGRISEGDLVVLTAFGAGFHWAAAALQF
ncbi:MAG: ketoacyl-ACP synthase III [bacterium]|nr:ketoacyl-ACP synthase III [bacterium]